MIARNLQKSIPVLMLCLQLSQKTTAAAPRPALSPQSRFEVTGDWRGGSIPGHAPGRGTLYCNSPNATATWFPAIQSACPVRLSFWVCPHPGNSPVARFDVGRPGGETITRDINLRQEPARWQTMGVHQFDGSGSEFIRLSRTQPGNLRVSGIKLDILDPEDSKMVWQTLILDELAAYDKAILAHSTFIFDDIPSADPLAPIAARLAADGIMKPTSANHFSPSEAMPSDHFLAALCRLLDHTNIDTKDHQAIRKHALSKGWLVKQPSDLLQLRDALSILVNAAKKSGRRLDWIKEPSPEKDSGPPGRKRLASRSVRKILPYLETPAR
jgi:hypothetical protein